VRRSRGVCGSGSDLNPVITVGCATTVQRVTGTFDRIVSGLIVVQNVMVAPTECPRHAQGFHPTEDVEQTGQTPPARVVMHQIAGKHDEIRSEKTNEFVPVVLRFAVGIGDRESLLNAAKEVVVRELKEPKGLSISQLKNRRRALLSAP
jgi:hypothetical protein